MNTKSWVKQSFGNHSGELNKYSDVSSIKSWADRMDEEENDDVIIKDHEVVQLGNEEDKNKETSTKENCISSVTDEDKIDSKDQGLNELEDSNMTDKDQIDTSVGVGHNSSNIELTMSVYHSKVSWSGGLETSLRVGHDSCNIESTVHVDHIEDAVIGGHDSTEVIVADLEEAQANPDLIAAKDGLIDKTIHEELNEEVEEMMTSDNVIVNSSTSKQLGPVLKRSSLNNSIFPRTTSIYLLMASRVAVEVNGGVLIGAIVMGIRVSPAKGYFGYPYAPATQGVRCRICFLGK
ncbi:hypothetical protein K7X08_035696 [Anisodus acutangulus]|uniref:Uncharacterized protein n=1 Tax=Anisodus acutangulus TaxID=402998 RepID=A0A9Q1LWX9_9SOLA|nr:hypothetical protein K7X08_035696 [Anisodus acutangulus]